MQVIDATLIDNCHLGNFVFFPLPYMNSTCCKLGHWLVIIGALNWGLVGLGDFLGQNLNVVNMLLGSWPVVESVVYVVVGLSAICKLTCKKC